MEEFTFLIYLKTKPCMTTTMTLSTMKNLSYGKQDTISSIEDYGLENIRGNSSSSSSSGFTTFDDLEQLQNYILAEMVSIVKKSVENQMLPISSLITTVKKKMKKKKMRFKNQISRDMSLMKRTERTRNDKSSKKIFRKCG